MKYIDIKKHFESETAGNTIILITIIALIYVIVSLYFTNHFFFNTVINGVDVSLKAHDAADHIIINYLTDFELKVIERDGETEEISGQDIEMQYNAKNSLSDIYHTQNSLKWLTSLFGGQKYYIYNLYTYNEDLLKSKINRLNCLKKKITNSQNIKFKYSNDSYEVLKEVYGNKIMKEKLDEAIKISISKGETTLDLAKKLCYEDPKYTSESSKTLKTKYILNKYVSTNIIYKFGSKYEILDRNTINKWLDVDEDLEVVISKTAITKYVKGLSKKYNTVGAARNFKTSTGKTVVIKGGLYGWKINQVAEVKELVKNITLGEVIEKEPIYTQKAISRGENEIGNTYVEINITRQHIWFYKDAKLITQGSVVTGNPNKGWSTAIGTYMLNYKQKYATLIGHGYETDITYWMPFYGNIGIHDASWRNSFGGEIYKRKGTHGCINAPLYLAKTIFDNIEDGIPIVCYEEE